jgi:hypothetical protein
VLALAAAGGTEQSAEQEKAEHAIEDGRSAAAFMVP